MIVRAANQAPTDATPSQIQQAEQWLVDQASGAGTRSGRRVDHKRLRQTARRMFSRIDRDLALRHEAILLGRESRNAEAETYLQLHDNGNGTWSGKFTSPSCTGTCSSRPSSGSPHHDASSVAPTADRSSTRP